MVITQEVFPLFDLNYLYKFSNNLICLNQEFSNDRPPPFDSSINYIILSNVSQNTNVSMAQQVSALKCCIIRILLVGTGSTPSIFSSFLHYLHLFFWGGGISQDYHCKKINLNFFSRQIMFFIFIIIDFSNTLVSSDGMAVGNLLILHLYL